MKKLQSITVKTGTTKDFFENLKNVMGAADQQFSANTPRIASFI